MFYVVNTDIVDHKAALNLLAGYDVRYSVYKVGDTFNIEVLYGNDFRPAEMAFQMNFRQTGKVCPSCWLSGNKICGHLTFTELM
jgi:hypothetical protein